MMQRPMTPQPFRLEEVQQETHNIFTWQLAPTRPGQSCDFLPGQFNMLYVFGVGEVPISISGASGRTEGWTHTIRAVGSVTNAMQKLKPGATIGVRGPFGTAWPVQAAEGCDVILMIGGLGLAPLRPVIYHLLANRDRYGKIAILYGTRTPKDIFFQEELKQWLARKDMQFLITVDLGLDNWMGEVGLVTDLVAKISFDPYHTVAMVCGPEIMMHFSALSLLQRGVAPESIWFSMERNMKCATGWCGHCQYGPHFICKDGAVFPYPAIQPWLEKKEI